MELGKLSINIKAGTQTPAHLTLDMLYDLGALRAFAQDVLAVYPLAHDELSVREIALRHGLLVLVNPTEPCGDKCECLLYYSRQEFSKGKVECLRNTGRLTGSGA